MKTIISVLIFIIIICSGCNSSAPKADDLDNDDYVITYQSLEIKVDEDLLNTNILSEITVKRDSLILITIVNYTDTFYYKEIIENDSIIFKCDSASFIFYPNNEMRHVCDDDKDFYVLYKNPI